MQLRSAIESGREISFKFLLKGSLHGQNRGLAIPDAMFFGTNERFRKQVPRAFVLLPKERDDGPFAEHGKCASLIICRTIEFTGNSYLVLGFR